MSLTYPHTITVTRTSGATQSATGGWTGGTDATVYSGRADVQDAEGQSQFVDGQWRSRGDAVIYVPGDIADSGIAEHDAVSITWQDETTTAGRVLDVVRLDDAFLVSYDVVRLDDAFLVSYEGA